MQDAIDVAPLMDEIAHELEPLAEKKGMSFRTEGGGTVLGSDRLIARALYNLAENAVNTARTEDMLYWLPASRSEMC